LRVCADPNNLPFTNAKGEGFENRIAELLADELGTEVEYTWWPQRRGFVRHTLRAGLCDLIVGVPADFELAWTTRPYYRSGYVFVTRAGGPAVTSLDDPALRKLRVGVQLVGDDYSNTPPAHALADRGMATQLVGYSVYGDYSKPNPPARIVDAVANGDVDVAVVWGPLAGYFGARTSPPLKLTPVRPTRDGILPFEFDISLATRRGDTVLHSAVEAAMDRRRADVDSILAAYHVPRADEETSP
ncbi:MAG: substrate-binding domain-containing protein, partial [Gemmatimonadota bacterium]|nr:substrate-binding domain-containing protein [Gemmatimonadota bacterium]